MSERWRIVFAILLAFDAAVIACVLLWWVHPSLALAPVFFLPFILIVQQRFGVLGGSLALVWSIGGCAWYRHHLLPSTGRRFTEGPWEQEVILLVFCLVVIALMEARRRSGDALFSATQQCAALLKNIADGTVVFNRDLRLVSLNTAASVMFDRRPEEVLGRTLTVLRRQFRFTSDENIELPLERAVKEGVSSRLEGVVDDMERNRRFFVIASFSPLKDSRNRSRGAVAVFTDVTNLKEMQNRSLDNARHIAIAQMTSGLSHDFNHILDLIRRAGNVLRIKEDAPATERRVYLDMIERAVIQGCEIVHGMQEYLSGGTGETSLVDMSKLAAEVIELTRPLWRTRPEIEVDSQLAKVPLVSGQPSDLRRVLVNLIINAIESLGLAGGQVTITTESLGDRVRCSVQDNGSGMPVDVQRRVFLPYTTTKPRGMGMGLFSAQKVVLAHGGDLSFFSESGRGTRFSIELPVAEKTEAA